VDHSRKTGGTEPDGVADLRNGGALSQRLPGYQERSAQIEMATTLGAVVGTHQGSLPLSILATGLVAVAFAGCDGAARTALRQAATAVSARAAAPPTRTRRASRLRRRRSASSF